MSVCLTEPCAVIRIASNNSFVAVPLFIRLEPVIGSGCMINKYKINKCKIRSASPMYTSQANSLVFRTNHTYLVCSDPDIFVINVNVYFTEGISGRPLRSNLTLGVSIPHHLSPTPLVPLKFGFYRSEY